MGATVDGKNPAPPSMSIYVLHYQNSWALGIDGLYKVMKGFYHQQYHGGYHNEAVVDPPLSRK